MSLSDETLGLGKLALIPCIYNHGAAYSGVRAYGIYKRILGYRSRLWTGQALNIYTGIVPLIKPAMATVAIYNIYGMIYGSLITAAGGG